MSKFDKATMTARYHELTRRREEILAVSGPLREARDAFASEAREKELAMNAQIKAAEKDLLEIEQERAFLARGLGHIKPAAPPADDAA